MVVFRTSLGQSVSMFETAGSRNKDSDPHIETLLCHGFWGFGFWGEGFPKP